MIIRLVAIGIVAGVFSSLFGVGGGILIVPLLMGLAAFPAKEAAATSLGAIGIIATAGALLYAFRGEVHPGYALLVGIPGAIGALGGAAAQQRLSNRTVTLCFAVLLAGVATWLIVG